VLQEVEEDRVAGFVGYEDLRALFVFVAWNHISLEEVVPWVGLLEGARTVELEFLSLQGEQKELPRLYQNQVDVVLTLEVEDGAIFGLLERGVIHYGDGALLGEAEELGGRQVDQLNYLLINRPNVGYFQLIQIQVIEYDLTRNKGCTQLMLHGRVVISGRLQKLQSCHLDL
jgi:hypothetical protein